MTYTRQDLRLICELIESDLNRHTRYSQSSNGQWIAQDYTYTTKEVIEIIRKHLLPRPTEEELQGVINAVKEAYTPDDEVEQTCETCKNIGGRNAHPGGKKGNLCFLMEHYCKISNRKTYPSSKACKNYEKED
jgi:hypothetical protein